MGLDVPEEVLKEILEQAIHPVPIEDYLGEKEHMWEEDLGGPLKPAPSDPLLVCKLWLRVATPIWYRYVRLSTTDQVTRLAFVLEDNPELGKMVRHLRLEGGYGKHLESVIEQMPNVNILSLQLYVRSKDSNVGLLRVLPLFNPTRLYLRGISGEKRQPSKKMEITHEAFCEAIKDWTSIERLYIGDECYISSQLGAAMMELPSLKLVSLHEGKLFETIRKHRALLDRLDVIHCRCINGEPTYLRQSLNNALKEMKGRVVLLESQDSVVANIRRLRAAFIDSQRI